MRVSSRRSPQDLELYMFLPSEAEVELLEPTHLPTRNWCRHCVRATGKESPHHEASPGGVSKFAD